MKKVILSIVAIATIALTSFGQAPEGFKYQAVVRDAGNVILNNQAVGMQIEILQGGIGGIPVYTESFAPTSNNYGLVNLEIGTGSTLDDFSMINWANDVYFIRTSIDVTGGSSYLVMGTSQLMSVPYALHSKTAENVMNDMVNDADADPTNEIQDISLSGTVLTLSSGSTIDLSVIDTDTQLTEAEVDAYVANNGYITNPDDADADPTNEIQDISLSGTNLTLSSGSTIDLAVIDTDTQIDSLGIVSLGFQTPIDYSFNQVETGEKWVDGKPIYKVTMIRSGTAYPNWSLLPPSFYETVIDYECKIVGINPSPATILYNSPYVYLSSDYPGGAGWLVLSNIDQLQTIQAGSAITIYYTKP